MCGIAGIYIKKQRTDFDIQCHAREMVRSIAHRGPDKEGLWIAPDEQIALGHRRLSIIDLSPLGNQPMASHSGRFIIAFNGEIYNYRELKKELLGYRIRFRGTSDTEVLLEAVSEWGMEYTLKKTVGMFAVALWDCKEHTLILSRDRVGKKPLYYANTSSYFAFASEIKALRLLPDMDLSVRPESLSHYLSFGCVPANRTIYNGIKEVRAGHVVRFVMDSGIRETKYWHLDWETKSRTTFPDVVEHADKLLKEAVRVRLRADVPVGCFLSGGIDSGLICAMASQELGTPLKTFTIKFGETFFDESPLAQLVADRYSCEHTVLHVRADIQNVLPKIVEAYDEPFSDSSAIPSYLVAKAASEHVRVVLIGDGGDELFGGYRRHQAARLWDQFAPFFSFVPSPAFVAMHRILPVPKKGYRTPYAFLYRFIRGLKVDWPGQYLIWCSDGFMENEKQSLLKTPLPKILSPAEFLKQNFGDLGSTNAIDRYMALDFSLNLHDNLLIKMDIATMAHSLEARSPFLDHRLIEWAATIPPKIRTNPFRTKPILRDLANRYLPFKILSAPKRGFESPLYDWLTNDLREIVMDTCLRKSGLINDLFNKNAIELLINRQMKNIEPTRWKNLVWKIFMLAMWDYIIN